MAVATQPQAIAGVSAGQDRVIEITYPSVAAMGLGQLVGQICESVPVKICHIKLSYLLFGLPLAPVGALLYLSQKVTGNRYILTNRGVEIRKSIGNKLEKRVELADIADVTTNVLSGQEFHHAADVQLRDVRGTVLATLSGVTYPDRLKSAIMEARNARVQNDAAFAQIAARK